jgi:RNA polymerase sigma-70 factor (ECF subfamily)
MSEFHELYERYYPDVFRFALFLTGDRSRAEDLTADTFVRAWTARDRLQLATVRSYLLTIARNLHRDALRRARPESTLVVDVVDPRPMVDAQVELSLTLSQVRARLRQVARGDRQAFLMLIARGMSHQEIATALGLSISAVKSRIFRAREALIRSTGRLRNGEST